MSDLTPFDRGTQLEPIPWPAPDLLGYPLEERNYSAVDLEDDCGTTVAVLRNHRDGDEHGRPEYTLELEHLLEDADRLPRITRIVVDGIAWAPVRPSESSGTVVPQTPRR